MKTKNSKENVTTDDVVDYLKKCADHESHGESKYSSDIRDALLQLAEILHSDSNLLFKETIKKLHKLNQIKSQNPKNKQETELPPNIAKLDNKELKSIVESGKLSKRELIALGHIRFGIPESGMKRLSKIQIQDSIISAISHNTSLNIISDVAKSNGNKRRS
jgi:hypothetical protein